MMCFVRVERHQISELDCARHSNERVFSLHHEETICQEP